MAGTVNISRASGACRFSTYGGPASDLPLISGVHGVVASGSRLGEQSQARGTQTQSYIQGDTRQARMASVPSPGSFKSLDMRRSTMKFLKDLEFCQTKSSQCGYGATTEEFQEWKKEMDDDGVSLSGDRSADYDIGRVIRHQTLPTKSPRTKQL